MKRKYIVWSYDEDESQTFTDIVLAANPREAAQRVRKARIYATLDLYIPPNSLKAYIASLQKTLDEPGDPFEELEKEAKEIYG